MLENNESGFTEPNVRSLCKVGDKRKFPIGKLYPELGSFFVDAINVDRDLQPEELAAAIEELSDKESLTDDEAELVVAIYHELSRWIDRQTRADSAIEPWFDEFIRKPVFWTTRGFWRNDSDIFVNDDAELCQHFENSEGIAFLNVPASHNSRLMSFTTRSGLQFASKAVNIRPVRRTAELNREWTRLLRRAVPHIARYLHAREYQHYKELAESGSFGRFSHFECLFVESLTVEYQLHGAQATARRQVVLDENKLLVDPEFANGDMIAAEFSRVFGNSDNR